MSRIAGTPRSASAALLVGEGVCLYDPDNLDHPDDPDDLDVRGEVSLRAGQAP